ncbi:MAG TPA: hypothetical protein VK779_10945 [Rhizomicrobium sp.]|jgi:hypothetical protein|nr:hypothetical protein [Rhizomicrobium sp.]
MIVIGLGQNGAFVRMARFKTSRLFAAICIAAAAIPVAAHAVQFVTFGIPGGTNVYGGIINSTSSVTGFYTDRTQAQHTFLRTSDGTIATFDAGPGTQYTTPSGLTRSGEIIGQYTKDGIVYAYKRGSLDILKSFKADKKAVVTYALGINNGQSITGYFYRSDTVRHGFLRSRSGSTIEFDAPDAADTYNTGTAAVSINESDAITGYYFDNSASIHGFLRSNEGTITEFDVPEAGGTTEPAGISNAGWIAGYYSDAGNIYHGFVRKPDGAFVTFDAPDAANGTYAYAINNHQTIIGIYLASDGTHSFIREKDGTLTEFKVPGATATLANSINDDGVVAGTYQNKNGVMRGFLRIP